MAKDDYELLPHAELEFLRKEVERLKKNPLGDTQASIGLLDSINELNRNVSKLVQIFQSANDDMARMSRDTSVLEEMRRIRKENAKIAHGIVALSEMLDGKGHPASSQPRQPEPSEPKAPRPSGEMQFDASELESQLTPDLDAQDGSRAQPDFGLPSEDDPSNPFMDDNEPLPPPPKR